MQAPPQPSRHQLEPGRSLRRLVLYFLKLGSSGFGGPIALVGYMQRDLVEQRRWYSQAEFQQGLAVGQTMPGPLAAQVAMWFGYLHAGARGAAAVAVPFVSPPFVMVTAVAVLYTEYQGLAWVHALFLGIGPAVLAIITIAAYKLARSTNETDPVAWVIAAVLCAVTAIAAPRSSGCFWPPARSARSTTAAVCLRPRPQPASRRSRYSEQSRASH
jgi:chromate transporter